MKVKPMIFNTEMVKALLDGRKVQTRRPVKHQPFFSTSIIHSWVFPRNKTDVKNGNSGLFYPNAKKSVLALSGYSVGDLVYVRETFSIVPRTAYSKSAGVQQLLRPDHKHDAAIYRAGFDRSNCLQWKPSIHMPRWASRLTLKVTGVRVERVQDISEADACLEGITSRADQWRRDAFKDTWQTIYGDSWERNDWVWVVDFEVISQNVDDYLKKQETKI